jgi:hypothetical protein
MVVRRVLSTFGVMIAVSVGCLNTAECFAEVMGRSEMSVGSAPFDMTGSALRMVGGLLLCLGLLAAGVRLQRRYGLGVAGSAKRRLQVLERVAISSKGALLLVALDGREFVLATGTEAAKLVLSQPRSNSTFDDELLRGDLREEECDA